MVPFLLLRERLVLLPNMRGFHLPALSAESGDGLMVIPAEPVFYSITVRQPVQYE